MLLNLLFPVFHSAFLACFGAYVQVFENIPPSTDSVGSLIYCSLGENYYVSIIFINSAILY